jgi:hypothetical protein
MTFAEFEFWKACVLRFADPDMSPADAGREADLLVEQYRLRAAEVVDYYGGGLYLDEATGKGAPAR